MDELKEGIEHEAEEHPDVTKGDIAIAKKIAMAHLKEDPKYYTHLEEMEAAVEKKKAIKGAVEKEKEEKDE